MTNKRKVIAVIPARGGSKRLPNKNILPLQGKPLIAWSIDAAKNSGVFDEIMVTTDSEEIKKVAIEYGASVPFLRDAKLATDTSTSMDAIEDVIAKYGEKDLHFDDIVLLQPTSPLRIANDIKQAYELYIKHDYNAIVSLTETEHPIAWSFKFDEKSDEMQKLFADDLTRSQDYAKSYRLNGAVFISKIENMLQSKTFIPEKNCFGYVMPQERSQDIDSKLDFDFADFLLARTKNIQT